MCESVRGGEIAVWTHTTLVCSSNHPFVRSTVRSICPSDRSFVPVCPTVLRLLVRDVATRPNTALKLSALTYNPSVLIFLMMI